MKFAGLPNHVLVSINYGGTNTICDQARSQGGGSGGGGDFAYVGGLKTGYKFKINVIIVILDSLCESLSLA